MAGIRRILEDLLARSGSTVSNGSSNGSNGAGLADVTILNNLVCLRNLERLLLEGWANCALTSPTQQLVLDKVVAVRPRRANVAGGCVSRIP